MPGSDRGLSATIVEESGAISVANDDPRGATVAWLRPHQLQRRARIPQDAGLETRSHGQATAVAAGSREHDAWRPPRAKAG